MENCFAYYCMLIKLPGYKGELNRNLVEETCEFVNRISKYCAALYLIVFRINVYRFRWNALNLDTEAIDDYILFSDAWLDLSVELSLRLRIIFQASCLRLIISCSRKTKFGPANLYHSYLYSIGCRFCLCYCVSRALSNRDAAVSPTRK